MPRSIAYCPSPLLFLSTVTPDILWMAFATVRSGDSSIALALNTLTTLRDARSMALALASVLPWFSADMVAPSSIRLSGSRFMMMDPVDGVHLISVSLYPMIEQSIVLSSADSSCMEKLPSSPETAHLSGFSLRTMAAPMISSPVDASRILPLMPIAGLASFSDSFSAPVPSIRIFSPEAVDVIPNISNTVDKISFEYMSLLKFWRQRYPVNF